MLNMIVMKNLRVIFSLISVAKLYRGILMLIIDKKGNRVIP